MGAIFVNYINMWQISCKTIMFLFSPMTFSPSVIYIEALKYMYMYFNITIISFFDGLIPCQSFRNCTSSINILSRQYDNLFFVSFKVKHAKLLLSTLFTVHFMLRVIIVIIIIIFFFYKLKLVWMGCC